MSEVSSQYLNLSPSFKKEKRESNLLAPFKDPNNSSLTFQSSQNDFNINQQNIISHSSQIASQDPDSSCSLLPSSSQNFGQIKGYTPVKGQFSQVMPNLPQSQSFLQNSSILSQNQPSFIPAPGAFSPLYQVPLPHSNSFLSTFTGVFTDTSNLIPHLSKSADEIMETLPIYKSGIELTKNIGIMNENELNEKRMFVAVNNELYQPNLLGEIEGNSSLMSKYKIDISEQDNSKPLDYLKQFRRYENSQFNSIQDISFEVLNNLQLYTEIIYRAIQEKTNENLRGTNVKGRPVQAVRGAVQSILEYTETRTVVPRYAREGDWLCTCGSLNFAYRNSCNKCFSIKPAYTIEKLEAENSDDDCGEEPKKILKSEEINISSSKDDNEERKNKFQNHRLEVNSTKAEFEEEIVISQKRQIILSEMVWICKCCRSINHCQVGACIACGMLRLLDKTSLDQLLRRSQKKLAKYAGKQSDFLAKFDQSDDYHLELIKLSDDCSQSTTANSDDIFLQKEYSQQDEVIDEESFSIQTIHQNNHQITKIPSIPPKPIHEKRKESPNKDIKLLKTKLVYQVNTKDIGDKVNHDKNHSNNSKQANNQDEKKKSSKRKSRKKRSKNSSSQLNQNGNNSSSQSNQNGNNSSSQSNSNGNKSSSQSNQNGNKSSSQSNQNGNKSSSQSNQNGNKSSNGAKDVPISQQKMLITNQINKNYNELLKERIQQDQKANKSQSHKHSSKQQK